jgi:5-methylcytosine-specific restriction enzyme A
MPWSAPTHGQPTPRAPDLRPSAAARGYGRRWRRYRLAFLGAHPVCQCRGPCCPSGCNQLATDVDHVQAVTGPDDPRFWDPANHVSLCHACHSRKTAREDGALGRAPAGRGG